MPASCGSYGEFPGAEADIAAAGVAEAVKAEKLVLMTNVPGVLRKDGTLFSVLTAAEIENLFADGTIHCGWQAKLNAALQAVRRGVKSVHVINGRVPGALLLELLTGDGLGTMIRADDVAQSLSDGRHCLAA
jgi:acetylglutamate kinase